MLGSWGFGFSTLAQSQVTTSAVSFRGYGSSSFRIPSSSKSQGVVPPLPASDGLSGLGVPPISVSNQSQTRS